MSATRDNPWLVRPRPLTAPAQRLFCFAHAGGSPAIFHSWSAALPETVELCAVQLPGRGRRYDDPPYSRMEPLIKALAPALRPALDVPFALFGHSLGALVAFELARTLQAEGRAAAFLLAAGCPAPQSLPPDEILHTLSKDDLLAALRRLNGIAPQLWEEKELLDLLLPALRADLALYETYEYCQGPPLSCPIIAAAGRQDPRARASQLEGWRRQTGARFDLHLFPGDHFFLNSARSRLLRLIRRELDRSPRDNRHS